MVCRADDLFRNGERVSRKDLFHTVDIAVEAGQQVQIGMVLSSGTERRVTDLAEGGKAKMSGLVKCGDVLTHIADVSAADMDHDAVVQLTKAKSKDTNNLSLEFYRPKEEPKVYETALDAGSCEKNSTLSTLLGFCNEVPLGWRPAAGWTMSGNGKLMAQPAGAKGLRLYALEKDSKQQFVTLPFGDESADDKSCEKCCINEDGSFCWCLQVGAQS
jgi:hypothetical protein